MYVQIPQDETVFIAGLRMNILELYRPNGRTSGKMDTGEITQYIRRAKNPSFVIVTKQHRARYARDTASTLVHNAYLHFGSKSAENYIYIHQIFESMMDNTYP